MTTSVLEERIPQMAHCQVCKAQLLFGTDGAGHAVEKCSNRLCVNHAPHLPRPDGFDLPRNRARNGEGKRRKVR